MRALLEAHARHDRQVDRPAKVHEVLLREVLDRADLGRRGRGRHVVVVVVGVILAVVVVVLAEDLALDLDPRGLVRLEVVVDLENVQCLLAVDLVVQGEFEGDLVVPLHQVQVVGHRRVVGEPGLARGEEALDRVLDALVDDAWANRLRVATRDAKTGRVARGGRARVGTLVQDAAESLEDRQQAPGRDLVEELADLLGELDGNFDRVVRRVVEEHGEQLQRHELVGHLVVAEVREELGEARGDDLVAAAVRAPEADEDALQQELAVLGELGVEDGDERRVDVREPGRRELGLHERAAEEAAAADEVELEQLRDDRPDVPDVYLVHEAVDALAQRLPGQSLELGRPLVLVRHLLPQRREFERRHVDAARPTQLGVLRRLARDHRRALAGRRRRPRALRGARRAVVSHQPVNQLIPRPIVCSCTVAQQI